VKIKRLQLELLFQSTLHSEKNKLISVSYDSDTCPFSYETYKQVKMTIIKNTMPSTLNFEPAYITVTFDNQEMVLPISHHMFNQKSEVLNKDSEEYIYNLDPGLKF
jgi:hypothetical protein